MSNRRVVVTGLGCITPIGKNVEETWNGIENGVCGVDTMKLVNPETFKTKMDAEVKDYNPHDYFDVRQARRLDRSSQFALIAAREAFADSGISEENTDFNIGGLITIQNQCEVNLEKGHNRISPMFIPMSIANMPAGNIAIELGLKGESVSIVTACASSTHAIGEAYRTIKHGYEDVILAGGTEASICEVGIGGFENMKALSSATDKNRASIPFDKERSGFVMGEGSGILVLEEYEHAKKRGAKIYAEIVGFGQTGDAYDVVAPCPEGQGAIHAMKFALEDAGLKPEDVQYINAHGTSTGLGDIAESKAIERLFGSKDENKNLLVSSTKSMHGHLLGATGAVECIACIKAINESIVPPTINLDNQDEKVANLDYVPHKARKAEVNVALSNSFGFGGQNASVVIKKV